MADITGFASNDILNGTDEDDLIRGLAGDDLLNGRGGDDRIEGGDDDDTLLGQDGDDVLLGGGGNDVLFEQNSTNDQLFGEAGDDQLIYSATISPLAHNALLDGGSGDDRLEYDAFDSLDGGTLIGGDGHDFIAFRGQGSQVFVDAGADSDLVLLGSGATSAQVALGSGADLLSISHDVFSTGNSPSITITDIEVGDGGDALVFGRYLALVLPQWHRDTNPFAGGYLRVVQRGSDAVLQYDSDAAAPASTFVDLITYQGVTAASLTAHNLGGYGQDGSISAGRTITGTAERDFLTGDSGADFVLGGQGDDRLFGAAGQDRLEGGDGVDELDGEAGDDILFGGAGDDALIDRVDGADRLFGQDGNDQLFVNRVATFSIPAGALELDGGTGHDSIVCLAQTRNDDITAYGRLGNDFIGIGGGGRVVVDAGAGDDEVSIDVSAREYAITLGVGADLLLLSHQNSEPLRTFTTLDFRAHEGDRIDMSHLLTSVLTGWDPATNPFAGGFLKLVQLGADTRLLIDRDGGGDELVLLGTLRETSAFSLGVEQLGYDPGSIARTGTDAGESLIGTPGADELLALGGDDFVVGAGSADDMDGGGGADLFAYNATADSLPDAFDTIRAFQSGVDKVDLRATLATFVDLVSAGGVTTATVTTLDGSMRIDLEGTAVLSDFLMPAGLVVGTPGNDPLGGNAQDNIIDGRAGIDSMAGNAGNDSFGVDNAADAVVEAAGEGIDTVYSRVSYTLPSEVEILRLVGAAAIAGTGNGSDNRIFGNEVANSLNGGAGADAMSGGRGDDSYFVDHALDRVIELAGEGTDHVLSSVSFTLGATVENLTLIGSAAINGTGNVLANTLAGNNAANILNGGAGADSMQGGLGNDGYVVDNILDRAVETSASGGTDRVTSSVSFSLGTNVENLALTGAANLNGTGNALANVLTGNGGNNFLNGAAGADTMNGGLGNDSYAVDNAGDRAIETSASGGTDQVTSSVSFTLGANVENLALIGAAAINGTGNGLANTILGNAAANLLDGKAGADAMQGGLGADTYVLDNAADKAIETSPGGGIDLVRSSVSYALGSNVENLTLLGAAAIDGTGNNAGNTLTGNGAANILKGLNGNDTLLGGAGNDALQGGAGLDSLNGGTGADGFVFNTALSATTNLDHILDFVHAIDEIRLDNAAFTTLAAGALSANAFRLGTAALDADDRILYDVATGALFFDRDGTGAAAAVQFATLDNMPASLNATDFVVI